ncbi:MAG: sugar ABC transporter permease [Firmicutes bacterium]|nr:sugar ABC transporter permease [Bacillota bacterium]
MKSTNPSANIKTWRKQLIRDVMRDWELYLLLIPTLVYFIVMKYGPMYGVQIAFKNFNGALGITGSPWVGLRHFKSFFDSYYFWPLIRNTVVLSVYSLIAGFPMPIILALMLNEVKNSKYKRTVQTVTYAPHFISTVVLVGMLITFLSPSTGIINHLRKALGFEVRNYIAEPALFRHLYVWSGIWQNTGWNSIIYLAALSSIDPQLHEAAIIDGASRWQRIWNINIPGILPTIVILFILSTGSIMNVGFEKAFLMQNPMNMETSDVISTYVYRRGLISAEYSFSAAIGLFNSVINFIMLVMVNKLAKKLGETSVW